MNLQPIGPAAGWLPSHDRRADPIDAMAAAVPHDVPLSPEEWRSLVRRHAVPLAAWVIACLAIAAVYLQQAAPQFVATTQVILEARRPLQSGPDISTGNTFTLDSAQADSQIQVVKSERILRYVFNTLDLAQNPIYAHPEPNMMQRIAGFFTGRGASGPVDQQAADAAAFQTFADRIGVRRIGQSYVLEISFLAPNAKEAARMANAVTAAYIRDQIEFRAAALPRGTEYLQGRITDIRTEQDAATAAVKSGVIPDLQFADSDARVVSAALEPLAKSYPQTRLILLFALTFGLVSGLGWIILRHSLDRTIRSRQQIARTLGYDCLAELPTVRGSRQGRSPVLRAALHGGPPEYDQALRGLRIALAASSAAEHLVLGIASCSTREGRSSVAVCLSRVIAVSGEPITLVDADLTHPSLSRLLAPEAEAGLSELLMDRAGGRHLTTTPIGDALSFLPAAGTGQQGNPNVYLGGPTMRDVISGLRARGHVVVDLPALQDSADTQAIGPFLDGVVLLVEIGRTTLDDVAAAVKALALAQVRLFGLVLNRSMVRASAGPL